LSALISAVKFPGLQADIAQWMHVSFSKILKNDWRGLASNVFAILFVFILHGFFALFFISRPVSLPPHVDTERTALRIISRVPSEVPKQDVEKGMVNAAKGPPAASSHRAARKAPEVKSIDAGIPLHEVPETSVAESSRPLELSLPPEAAIGNGAEHTGAADFRPKIMRHHGDDPEFSSPPERFRMRPNLPPRDVIAAVSKFIGLWPPGYTIDPCAISKEDVDSLRGSVSGSERAQLEDALRKENQTCR